MAGVIDYRIVGDTEKPRRKGRLGRVVVVKVLIHLEESYTRHVVSVRVIFQPCKDKIINSREKILIQLLEGIFISRRPLSKFVVIIRNHRVSAFLREAKIFSR